MLYIDPRGHLMSDVSLEELHVFATRIGIKRHWFEGVRKSHPHYDLTTEINRLVANVKYDYVRGYIEKNELTGRLSILDLPDEVIRYHVIDAEEDRIRKHNDRQLSIIEEAYVDGVIELDAVEEMARPILKDTPAYQLFLDEAYLNKFKSKRVFVEVEE